MTQRTFRTPAVLALGALLGSFALSQTQTSAPESPYGGTTVEEIVARVNDQIISKSDYDRALAEMDQEASQNGETMQQKVAAHKDLLRNLIDQQLWLSKGKELSITGETELIKRLDDLRKQYNLATLEDLEKAAKDQGVSYEDFKANIRNQLIIQLVMRQEVYEHLQITPGEVERYYEQHKQDYTQPESERLSEILISASSDDAAKVAAAKIKADDIETRLHAGGDFAQLARSFSDGPTAASGGNLGSYKRNRNELAKVLEDRTFALKTGEYTDPILTRQGYVILKVDQHTAAGPAPYKDVQDQVEEACYMTRAEPAIRDYLNKMRNEAAITVKQGYTDSGATPAELSSSISYSAYVAPSPKKKAKVQRTRFRESAHGFRQKTKTQAAEPETVATQTQAATKKGKTKEEAAEKPGKKEKIRYGQAPRATLPAAAKASSTEDAGAVAETPATEQEPANPLEAAKPQTKGRYSDRARLAKKAKPASETGTSAADTPDAAEVADRQVQSAPLGLNGDTSKSKKKHHKQANATSGKSRISDRNKKQETPAQPQPGDTGTAAPDAGAAAPASQPQK